MELVVFMSFNEAMFCDSIENDLVSSLLKTILNICNSLEELKLKTGVIGINSIKSQEVITKEESLNFCIRAFLYLYNRAEETDLVEKIKIDENDLFVIHYLVKLLD